MIYKCTPKLVPALLILALAFAIGLSACSSDGDSGNGDTGPEMPMEPDTGPEMPMEPDTGPEMPMEPDTGPEMPMEPDTGPEMPMEPDTDSDGIPDSMDVDDDGDGLIEISTLAHLDAVRNDLDGNGAETNSPLSGNTNGCPGSGCNGYELTANLNFDVNGDNMIDGTNEPTYWNSGDGWEPIGDCGGDDCIETDDNPYTATFDGNGFTISNLYINRESLEGVGLFAEIGPDGTVRNLGLISVNVRGGDSSGSLTGANYSNTSLMPARVINCYATGEVEGNDHVGGLVGQNTLGRIRNSYSAVTVIGNGDVGGLLGLNTSGMINDSYATGDVTGGGDDVGGLAGANFSLSSLNNGYATGDVTSTPGTNVGGLIGINFSADIGNSYATGTVSGSMNVGGFLGRGASSRITGSDYFVNSSGTNGIGISEGTCNPEDMCELPLQKTIVQIQGYTNTAGQLGTSWTNANWDFRSNTEHPAVKYGGTAGTDCEMTGTNADMNEGGSQPDCGDLLPGQ